MGRAGAVDFCRAREKFRRRLSCRLCWRHRVLAGIVVLAAADSSGGPANSWLVRLEHVHGGLFWNLDLAARRKNRHRQLDPTKSLVARGRGGVGRARNFPVIFSGRFSVESAGDFAIPAHAADPDRFRHRGLRSFISGRMGFAGDVLGGARHFFQTQFAFRMAAGSFPATADRRHFIRRWLFPNADTTKCKRKPIAACASP